MRRIILSSVATPYSSTLSQKGHSFSGGGVTENEIVFSFFMQILSETFLNISRIQKHFLISAKVFV
jgi:hypothetical protein